MNGRWGLALCLSGTESRIVKFPESRAKVCQKFLSEGQKGTPKRGRDNSEVQKRGKLAREVRSCKDKINGRERDALSWHFLSRPLPGVPSDLH